MSQDIVWEEPPATESRRGAEPVWSARLAPLRERPGAWARVVDGAKKSAAYAVGNSIKHGKYRGVEPGEFEVSVRRIEGGDWGVWARFVGGS